MDKLLSTSKDGDLTPSQTYAVLSQRLALDANTPQYLFCSANPLHALETMQEQIANHMRVCVAIEDGIETLRGIAPSEPILSEAASRIMLTKKFSLHGALSHVLTGFCIDQGDRGELIVTSFFIWARDQVVKSKLPTPNGQLCPYFSVTELFKQLFTELAVSKLGTGPSLHHPRHAWQSFDTAFQNARMHFNHVIKPQEQKILQRPYLLYLMARGAAVLGANCQPGFDAVYQYLYNSTDLDVKKVGFVIVQVKNASNGYNQGQLDEIFLKMDPFECGLAHKTTDNESGQFPIPIIRILFLLSTSKHDFWQHTYSSPSRGARTIQDEGPLFTSYDYVCVGVDPSILRPTQDASLSWAALVNKRDGWDSFYDVTAPEVLRSQLPGHASNAEHFSSWSSNSVLDGYRGYIN